MAKVANASQYKGMATTGSSRATEAGRVSALKHANIFRENKGIGKFDDLSEIEICTEKIFKEFATYLAEQNVELLAPLCNTYLH